MRMFNKSMQTSYYCGNCDIYAYSVHDTYFSQ